MGRALQLGAALALLVAGAASAAPGSLDGVWFNSEFKPSARFPPTEMVLKTEDGQMPPLQPWAAEIQQKRLADALAGRPFAGTKTYCLPAGLPQSMMGPLRQGMKFVETPSEVIILIEELNNFRIVRLNAPHLEDPTLSFLGDSIGRWEGDTLVVDTIGLNDRTTLDFVGMPHSDALHVVERYRRVSPERMELQITIDDPKTFTRPWTTKTAFRFAPGEILTESLCENNRNQAEGGVTTVQLPGR